MNQHRIRRKFMSGRNLTKQKCKNLDRAFKLNLNRVNKSPKFIVEDIVTENKNDKSLSNSAPVPLTTESASKSKEISENAASPVGSSGLSLSHKKPLHFNHDVNLRQAHEKSHDTGHKKVTGDRTYIISPSKQDKSVKAEKSNLSAYQYMQQPKKSKKRHRKNKNALNQDKNADFIDVAVTRAESQNPPYKKQKLLTNDSINSPVVESVTTRDLHEQSPNITSVTKSVNYVEPSHFQPSVSEIEKFSNELNDDQFSYLKRHFSRYIKKKYREWQINQKLTRNNITWKDFRHRAVRNYKLPSNLDMMHAKLWKDSKITEILEHKSDAGADCNSFNARDTSWDTILREARKKRRHLNKISDDASDGMVDTTHSSGVSDHDLTLSEYVVIGPVRDSRKSSLNSSVPKANVVAKNDRMAEIDAKEGEKPKYFKRSHAVDSGVVIATNFPELVIHGRAQLSVLWGEIAIFGHKMAPESAPVDVTSLKHAGLLTIRNEFSQRASKKQDLKLDRIDGSRKLFAWLPKLSSSVVVLFIQPTNNLACAYLAEQPKYAELFTVDDEDDDGCSTSRTLRDHGVDMTVLMKSDAPRLVMTEFEAVANKWNSVLQHEDPSIIICGGKNSGKSTLGRFVINSTLNRFESVCYLDCDIGQTEFSPPGCVSLNILTEPVFGPAFAHQRTPECAYFYGAVTPSNDPDFYIQCIRTVYDHYMTLEPRPPLIINTLGWNKSLGFRLLIDIFHMMRPRVVAQLVRASPDHNLPDLVPRRIATSHGWIYNKEFDSDASSDADFKHDVVIVKSMVDEGAEDEASDSAGIRPKDLRDMSTLACLVPALRGGYYDSFLSVTPHKIRWRDVAIDTGHDGIGDRNVLMAINASVVALGHADLSQARHIDDNSEWPMVLSPNQKPLVRFISIGLVRGVDMDERMIYITSPLYLDQMSGVNTIMAGADQIPEVIASLVPITAKAITAPYRGAVVDTPGAFTAESSNQPRRHFQFL